MFLRHKDTALDEERDSVTFLKLLVTNLPNIYRKTMLIPISISLKKETLYKNSLLLFVRVKKCGRKCDLIVYCSAMTVINYCILC